MKKRLFFITGEGGFFLPYVLFIAALVFMMLTASTNIYKNDIEITHGLAEQLQIKTLRQMGEHQFKKSLNQLDDSSGNMAYTFPNGAVRVHYEWIKKTELVFIFYMETKTGTKSSFGDTIITEEDKKPEDGQGKADRPV